MESILAVVNTFLLVINLVVIVYGVKRTIDYNRFNRTWSYIERYNSDGMLESKIAVALLLERLEGLTEMEQIKIIEGILIL